MKKLLIVLLCVCASGLLLAQMVTVNADRATLRARVAFLEKYIQAPEQITEEEAQELLSRLNRTHTEATPELVRQLVLRVAELESQIPGGVVSAQDAKVGMTTNVFGTVSQVSRGTDKNGYPYVNITLRGGFSVVWFRADTSSALYNISVGAGLVVSGKIGEYNGLPQIIVNDVSQVTLGD